MKKEETAFEQACRIAIEEAFSNIFADAYKMDKLKIPRTLWKQIFVYQDKDGNEVELTTPPEQLMYTDYDQSLVYKDSYITRK